MSILSCCLTSVPLIVKAAGFLNRSGLLTNQPCSPRVNPPVCHKPTVPPPTKMAFKNNHYSKLWALHGSFSTGLNWLSHETQHEGTSVCTDPGIHRKPLVSEILKVPSLSLNTPPQVQTDFRRGCCSKRWVMRGSFSTGLNWLSNETQPMKPERNSTSVSLNTVIPPLLLYNTKPPAQTDFKDGRSLSTGLNCLSVKSQGEQDDTSASINHVMPGGHPDREKLQLPPLSLLMSFCLCPDISGTANDQARENIKTAHRETPQPAGSKSVGITTFISAARERMKAAYCKTKERTAALYSTTRARILASTSELQLVFLPSKQKMFVLPSEDKVLLVFPRQETKLQAIFKESGKRVSYTLPEPVDRMWIRFPGPNRELYLSLPQSMLEATLSFSEKEDLQLFFEESNQVLQLYYQGPMARIVDAFWWNRQRIDDFVSTMRERCMDVFSSTEMRLILDPDEQALQVIKVYEKYLFVLPKNETKLQVIYDDNIDLQREISLSEPEGTFFLEFSGRNRAIYLTCPQAEKRLTIEYQNIHNLMLIFKESNEAVHIQIYHQGPKERLVAAFWRTRQRINDFVLRIHQGFSDVFSGIRSRILASMTEVTIVCHQSQEGLQIFPSEGKLLLFLPKPESQVLVRTPETALEFLNPEPETIMWLEYQKSTQRMFLTCPRSMQRYFWNLSDKDEARLFFGQSDQTLDVQIYYQRPRTRLAVALMRTIFDKFLMQVKKWSKI